MQLSELLLNRALYRDNTPLDATSALSNQFNNPGGNVGSSTTNPPPAENVAPGTIIQSALIQSSGSDDRIEINPDDTFRAYTNGSITTLIDSNGIQTVSLFADEINVGGEIILSPDGNFEWYGLRQSFNAQGLVVGLLSISVLPPGWSFTKNGTGDYTITFDTTDWPPIYALSVLCSPISGHFRYQVYNVTTSVFSVSWQESTYAAGLYTGEAAVDVSFNFVVFVEPNL